MSRHLRTGFVLVLLAATTVAFVVTERLKLEPAPITDTRVRPRVFAPLCDCPTLETFVSFRLRRSDTLTVSIIDARGEVIRTLLLNEPVQAGLLTFAWNGRDDRGRLVPEASYRPRVELRSAARTFELPNPIRVDTTAPRIQLVSLRPRTISPDGDGRGDRASVAYRQSERGRPLLFVNGRIRVRSKSGKLEGKLDWYGRVRRRPVPAGTYRLTLTTRDLAGNLAVQPVTAEIAVRYVELEPRLIRVRPGAVFRLRVSTHARRVRWRIGRRTGTARPPALRLRAPARPGRYAITVGYGDHRARARLVVRRGR